METPGGREQLCVLLLGGEEGKRRDVGCQWESPEEERRKEVGCQSDFTETRDASVQVDLLTQQLSWRHSGSPAMLLQCLTVRPDGSDGGALLQHCTTNRTRTRIIRPAVKLSDEPTQTRTKRGLPPQYSDPTRPHAARRRLLRSPDLQLEEEEEEDTGDPIWTPTKGSHHAPVQADSVSQHAPVQAVKLEPGSSVCEVCGKVMKNKSSLARHSFIHTGNKPFSCHLCELRFNRRDNLQHHLTHLHPDGVSRREKRRASPSWLCAVCGKTFSCRSRLKTHEVIHSGVKPHRCPLCPKAYMRVNDLEHHRKVVHESSGTDPTQPTSLLCDSCGKEFRCRSQLVIHFQTHTGERPHLCDVCGRKFSRQYQLKRHKILMHANFSDSQVSPRLDGAFACGVCGKRLKTEALLDAHTQTHTGDKPHRCTICLRGFQRATCLKQHHARVHLRVRGGEAPPAARRRGAATLSAFPCPICGRVFRFRSLLASHALVHSDVRPFACDFCSRSFRRHSHLKRHREVVHANGARPPQTFVCHICGKDKKCRSQLARHIIIHTGERPYACDLCSAHFNRRGNLQQHRRRMHGVGVLGQDEAPPILFDDDDVMADALVYKQETVDAAGELSVIKLVEESCDTALSDDVIKQVDQSCDTALSDDVIKQVDQSCDTALSDDVIKQVDQSCDTALCDDVIKQIEESCDTALSDDVIKKVVESCDTALCDVIKPLDAS